MSGLSHAIHVKASIITLLVITVMVITGVLIHARPKLQTQKVEGMKERARLADSWALEHKLPNYTISCVHKLYWIPTAYCTIVYDFNGSRAIVGVKCEDAGCRLDKSCP